MTKTQKAEIIEVLSNEFKDAQSVIFCDYKGLSVSKLETLRKMARAKDAKVQVVKNTLATIALSNLLTSTVNLLMLLKLKHLLNFQDVKNYLVCLHLFGWDQSETLRLVWTH